MKVDLQWAVLQCNKSILMVLSVVIALPSSQFSGCHLLWMTQFTFLRRGHSTPKEGKVPYFQPPETGKLAEQFKISLILRNINTGPKTREDDEMMSLKDKLFLSHSSPLGLKVDWWNIIPTAWKSLWCVNFHMEIGLWLFITCLYLQG